MHLGILLNRVFRIEGNPLFNYIAEHLHEIEKLYLILPIEDLSDAASVKREHYHKMVESFVSNLSKNNISPYIVNYDKLGELSDDLNLSHILVGRDIMSYHSEVYDYPHIKAAFQKQGIDVIGRRVNHYFRPTKTLNQQQKPYKVFTSFYKANRKNIISKPTKNYQLKQLSLYAEKGTNQSHFNVNMNNNIERRARKSWQSFLNNDISYYQQWTDDVELDFVSGISQYLAYGVLDIQEILNDLLDVYDQDEANCELFIRELMFREFYYVLMVYYPETAKVSFSEKYRMMQWSNNQTHFDAWKQGQTGYPIVDAAMQKLNRTGLMHNRLRMVVSQFLTKNLFIDWTCGESYFRKYLLDYDSASNVHGWQWSASTGTDAVPYFRMFNPIRQSERFDSKGYFIKTQLEIFENVEEKYVHNPTKYRNELLEKYQVEVGKDYPKTIVDHKTSREYVMHQFKQF